MWLPASSNHSDPTETTPAWISRRAFLFAKGKPVPLSRDWRRERAFFYI